MAELVLLYRSRARMTQDQLSAASGVKKQTISQVENGSEPRQKTLRRIVEALAEANEIPADLLEREVFSLLWDAST
ncbi:MAG TPA: helix-turn-helix transcriptional regulator [Actinomycetota bacterium]|nr:helix-turn-helix transcriptional regulator [Actinomycetota bacterium]